MGVSFYAPIVIVAAVILYVNTVSILKKVKKEEKTIINTIIGSICSAIIIWSILLSFPQ